MPSLYTTAILCCLILAPLVAHHRKGSPSALFAVAALIYAVFAGVDFIAIRQALNHVQDADPAYRDTYVIVQSSHASVRIAVILAVFSAATWAQTRLGAMIYPRATKALFWLFHLSLIFGGTAPRLLGFFADMPRRYTDYPEAFETNALIISLAVNFAALAAISIAGLLIWSSASVLRARWSR